MRERALTQREDDDVDVINVRLLATVEKDDRSGVKAKFAMVYEFKALSKNPT